MSFPLKFSLTRTCRFYIFTSQVHKFMEAITKTPVRIESHCNYEAASGDHSWMPSVFVIPGLTRNPEFLSGFPLSRE